mmetsp:Transcript_46073/g.72139  ORF Transcript_46073/g.72139 Transcript_46073/m.72139 type:complete len:92 (-) Transcript_46073:20-295(-)
MAYPGASSAPQPQAQPLGPGVGFSAPELVATPLRSFALSSSALGPVSTSAPQPLPANHFWTQLTHTAPPCLGSSDPWDLQTPTHRTASLRG